MKEDLLKIYNRKYVLSYHQTPGRRYGNIFSKINLNVDDVILDLGCGNGLLYEKTKNSVKEYFGLDFSKTFINECKKRYLALDSKAATATFVHSDIIEFCSNQTDFFSKVFMLDFTEHVYDKELVTILSVARNSLKSRGKLYIHTPNKNYLLEILKNHKIMKQTIGHVAVRDSEQYEELLHNSGFNNIQIIYLPHYNFLRFFDFIKHIPIIGNYFRARLLISASK